MLLIEQVLFAGLALNSNGSEGSPATDSCSPNTSGDSEVSPLSPSDSSKRKAEDDCIEEDVDCKRRRVGDLPEDSSDEEGEASVGGVEKKKTGLPCLLKVMLGVKMVNNNIIIEMTVQGGLMGRDGANQLLQYLKNNINKPLN